MRIGQGYDVHRLVPDRPLVLGGVRIDHPLGLDGHSDADVLTHAVTDALLGSVALGDLGSHFPDSDDRWQGADSLELLSTANRLLADRGYEVVNVDVTLIAEKPRVAPYIEPMRSNLARAMDLTVEQVSVKATTTEGLGPWGRGEGMAALAVVMVKKI